MFLGELDLNANPAIKSLLKLSEKIEKFESNLKNIGKELGGFYLIYEAVMQVAEGFENTLEMGAHLRDLSIASGQSVHDLVILGHALDLTGGSANDAQMFLFKLQTAISGVNEEGKGTATALKLLNLDLRELRTMSALEQVEALQKGLSKIGNQADKVSIIKDLFGFRFASKAAPLLINTEGLETARKQAEPLAEVMDRNAEAFHALDDAIKGAKLDVKEFFAGALESLAPDATGIADAIASINFVGIGRGFGEMLDVLLKFANILVIIAPAINAVSSALEHLNSSSLKGGILGAALGFVAAGPVGAIAGAIGGGFAGNVIGGSTDKPEEHRWADQFKGLQDPGLNHESDHVGALQKIGGGGGFGADDPLLHEAQRQTAELQRQTSELQEIKRAVEKSGIEFDRRPAVPV